MKIVKESEAQTKYTPFFLILYEVSGKFGGITTLDSMSSSPSMRSPGTGFAS